MNTPRAGTCRGPQRHVRLCASNSRSCGTFACGRKDSCGHALRNAPSHTRSTPQRALLYHPSGLTVSVEKEEAYYNVDSLSAFRVTLYALHLYDCTSSFPSVLPLFLFFIFKKQVLPRRTRIFDAFQHLIE